jgi:CheY-like chemotaxis protein
MPTRLLIVDDDPAIHLMVEAVLGTAGGFEVSHAHGGRDALVQAVQTLPDVILLDHVMPDMDGPAVLENLLASPQTASIPVIFLTGKSKLEDVRRLIAQGAKGVIPKPFRPTELQVQIEAILDADPS